MEPRARLDDLRRRDILSLDQYLDELEKLDAATAAPSPSCAASYIFMLTRNS